LNSLEIKRFGRLEPPLFLHDAITSSSNGCCIHPKLSIQSSSLHDQPDQPDAEHTFTKSIPPDVLEDGPQSGMRCTQCTTSSTKPALESAAVNVGGYGELAHSIKGRT